MENYILELSQEKSKNVKSNGDWVTNLADKNIVLNEGDQLNIKSVFLDTVSLSSGKVLINEKINLNIGVVQYLYNWQNTTDFILDPVTVMPNGLYYIRCSYKVVPPLLGASPFEKVTTIEFSFNGDDKSGSSWGGVTADFSYTDPEGNKQVLHVNIPYYSSFLKNFSYTATVNVICEVNSFNCTNIPTLTEARTMIFKISTEPVNIGDVIFTPVIKTFTMTLEEGSYDPQTLCEKISKACSVNKSQGVSDTNFVTSEFLESTDSLTGAEYYVRQDGLQTLKVLNSSDASSSGEAYWSGASQIEFSFDTDVNKFKINFLHMPMLDAATSSNICVKYFKDGGSNNILTATANSGCILQSLTAEVASTGKNFNFWEAIMGFNLGLICPHHKIITTNTISAFPNCQTPAYTLITQGDYTNLVTGYAGLDTAIIKGAGKKWYEVPKPAILPFDSTIQETNGIIAQTPFENIILDSSHYLIELNSTFINNFVTENIVKGNIQGIVSRYYGYDQYTSSEGQGSIAYIHRGDPVYIKSISCRILNPDLTLANIGDKNHIYLELIKPLSQNKNISK